MAYNTKITVISNLRGAIDKIIYDSEPSVYDERRSLRLIPDRRWAHEPVSDG